MGWNHHHLRTLRFSLLLPSVQFPLAVALWEWGRRVTLTRHLDTFYWPTPALVCYGINAPAVFFKLLAFPFTRGSESWRLPSVLSYSLEDATFFAGVIILWLLIGKTLDRRWSGRVSPQERITARRVLGDLLLVGLGIALLLEGLEGLHTPWRWGNHVGNIVESTMFLIWSFTLITVPILRLVKRAGGRP